MLLSKPAGSAASCGERAAAVARLPLNCIPTPLACALQVKGTVLLMPSGSDRITGVPLQTLQSDKACEDEEVKALLATRWGRLMLQQHSAG